MIFERGRVSPADTFGEPEPADTKPGPPPAWATLTHPVLAPPPGARPFYLAGARSALVTPFVAAAVPTCTLSIQIGEVAVIRNLYVAFDVTLNPDTLRFWSLNLNGVPVGNGYGAGYTFSTGWSTTNGIAFFPLDLRITQAGTVDLTVTDTSAPGSTRVFCGILQGWLYPATFDGTLNRVGAR